MNCYAHLLMKRHQLSHYSKISKTMLFPTLDQITYHLFYKWRIYNVSDPEGHVTMNEVSGLHY